MNFRISTADCSGDAKNCSYPHEMCISTPEQLKEAVVNDHVCATYRNHYRSKDNFLSSDVLVMDIDNDHTSNPDEHITPEKMESLFPDINYALVPSRHHMKEKNGKGVAPRYHAMFQISKCSDPDSYANMKKQLYNEHPFFDGNALDAGRFLFGSQVDEVIWHEGSINIDDILPSDPIIEDTDIGFTVETEDEEDTDSCIDTPAIGTNIIPAGSRNNTMHEYAVKVIKRYGISDEAKTAYLELSRNCDPPLDDNELSSIWNSASGFYANTISKAPGYVPPSDYNSACVFTSQSLIPEDYSDLGEAKILSREYKDELKYTPATGYLKYDGQCWQEDKAAAFGSVEAFMDMQLMDAQEEVETAKKALIKAGLDKKTVEAGEKAIAAACQNNKRLIKLLPKCQQALEYLKFVLKYRNYQKMSDVQNAAIPMFAIDVNSLDKNPFLLNAPDATYDLREGLNGDQPHDPNDLITKITACSPGDTGTDIWQEALKVFFCNDQELIEYVQCIVGLATIGKVFSEIMILAYGGGKNGKSTFWNAIFRVLGSYAGKISPDSLTTGCRRNVKPEMAELKGKRLVISSEMEEGMRLNTGVVKQLTSTDEIQAEKKYKDPFHFVPSHLLVLYTNHLPKVGANDEGIWRRLVVIPFNAVISGSTDIKNYADYLVENAGPAIMTWIIEGAKKVIDADYHIKVPTIVKDAINDYRNENDWLGQFLDDCCEVNPSYSEKSGELYQAYRSYCIQNGEYARSTTDFYIALEREGFDRHRTSKGSMVSGLKLCNDPGLFEENDD